MRQLFVLFAALILTSPPAAHAQPRQGGRQRPPPPPTMPPAQPSVPPPIIYPFPPLMVPPAGALRPNIDESPRFRRNRRTFFPSGSAGYAPFLFEYQERADSPSSKRSRAPASATGLLRLSVTPTAAQVFVDSYYVGTVEDVNEQRVLEIEAGPHQIEFRAPQYQTLSVDVRILPYETVTYRGALEPTRLPVPPAPAAGPPTVMYVIPKCYMGNLPPRQSRLPSGCDVKQVQVLRPTAVNSRR